jgi:hypothetical protein
VSEPLTKKIADWQQWVDDPMLSEEEWCGVRRPEMRALLAALASPAPTLDERLLDIGTDHEGCRLRVVREEDDDELGPGHWLLQCEDHDESAALLDFRTLSQPRSEDRP